VAVRAALAEISLLRLPMMDSAGSVSLRQSRLGREGLPSFAFEASVAFTSIEPPWLRRAGRLHSVAGIFYDSTTACFSRELPCSAFAASTV